MKIEKNKIVFAAIIAAVVIILISYTVMVMDGDKTENSNLKGTSVPELKEDPKEYDSKLDAINDLKEAREANVPSVYDEKMIDDLGYYDPDLPELRKQRIIDSIYASGRIKYSEKRYRNFGVKKNSLKTTPKVDSSKIKRALKIQAKELGLEHQLFFASNPKESVVFATGTTDAMIYAVVDGNQVVKADSRLRMRLSKAATINGKKLPKNTPIFGFIRFQPNRVLITIENIQNHPTQLKAFDFQ